MTPTDIPVFTTTYKVLDVTWFTYQPTYYTYSYPTNHYPTLYYYYDYSVTYIVLG